MPFGLKNAAQAFQRLMDGILQNLRCCFVYLDDILVASSSPQEHEADLRSVFQSLAANGLVINTQKCLFGQPTMTFFDHKISQNGITPLPEKVKAIGEFPKANDKKASQRFLGMINFYHRFLPGIAKCLTPLTEATKSKSKAITWAVAFQAAKSALASATLLNHPDPKSETQFTTDIQYIIGTDNVVPDVLSRAIPNIEESMVASASPLPAIDLAQMAIEQPDNVYVRHDAHRGPFVRPYDVRPYDVRPYDVRPYDVRPYDVRPYDVRPYDVRPPDGPFQVLSRSDKQFDILKNKSPHEYLWQTQTRLFYRS
ncbi:hypothetical protein EGW08_004978 [Elysia chlorotica]|uniref:Reverse transcriptase domain-containing protein n=1 Tax=Elysia chlorotica TaxID=188477 RepID=A0A3S1BMQ3_ELYCH|nr:hypothetical protein EGW08_004978 [Elysia chlorotica]